jgi:hypothetical protein
MNWIVEFAISIITGILGQVIKNPAKYSELLTVLEDLETDLGQAIAALQAQQPGGGTATATPVSASLQAAADRVAGKK